MNTQFLPYCLYFVLTLVSSVVAQEKQHLQFTTNEALDSWRAMDGQGGSSKLEDLSLEVSLVDGPDAHPFAPIAYKSEYQLMTTDSFGGLTTFDQDGTGWRGHRLREVDGKPFKLLSLRWFDYGRFNGMQMEIIGFREGKKVGSHAFRGNEAYRSISIDLPEDFPAVDEALIITANPSQKTYPVINGITVMLTDWE